MMAAYPYPCRSIADLMPSCYGLRPEGWHPALPALPACRRHGPVFLFWGYGLEPSGCLFLPETKKISRFLLIFGSGIGKARRLKLMSSKKRNLSRFLGSHQNALLAVDECICSMPSPLESNIFQRKNGKPARLVFRDGMPKMPHCVISRTAQTGV